MEKSVIYANGNIITMDPAYPRPEAVGVCGSRIAAVGSLEDVRLALRCGSAASDGGGGGRPEAEFADLQGRTLLPGFIDGHSHFPSGGMNRLFGVDLGVPTLRELKERLAAKARDTRPGGWIIGHSFDEQGMDEKRFPTRRDLDEACADIPIFMRHITGHTGMANSAALRLAGIQRDTPNPTGGIIGRDADGEPDGVLEGIPAQSLVRKRLPAFTPEEMREALLAESRVYAACGVTTAQGGPAFSPMDAELGHKVTELIVACAQDGSLPIRTVLFVRANAWERLAPYPTPVPGTDLSGNGMVTLGAAKLWADGDPRARTGHFSRPYLGGEPYYGEFLYTEEELAEIMLPMHRAGWQLAVHANGDAGIETVLGAYERLQKCCPRPAARHLIIHAQYAHSSQLTRMRRIGAYPCFFISPLWHWDVIHALHVGDERVENFCPCADAEQAGLAFNLHSDAPITPVAPLIQVGVAVTRTSKRGITRGRHQAISVHRALRAVTLDAAFLNFEAHCKGSLTPGKYADFTILEENPLSVAPERIHAINVRQTIVGGKTVFDSLK